MRDPRSVQKTETVAVNGKETPYEPSWVDRFTDWVEKLPLPGWVLYLSLGFVLVLCQILFLRVDGGLAAAEELLPVILFNGFAVPFLLALIYSLDRQAVIALDSIKPALEMTEPDFQRFRYELSNMPRWAVLISGLVMLAFYVLMERLWNAPIRFAALEEVPTFAIVFHVVDKSSAFGYGAFFYHTIRQLFMVHRVNSKYTRVRLFNLGPLQAFSKLTASTAVGLVVGMYGWMLINPDLLADPVSVGFAVAFTILAVVAFIWPLSGAHRLMESEKQRALSEIDLALESLFSEFNERLGDDDYSAIERLNGILSGLEIQRKRIAAIPTWPWRPETARWALTAIAVPLILTILQLFAAQLFDW